MATPNIILVLVDDLGYGDLSCFNADSRIRTENLDRIAREGMKCTDVHASSALCTPSRYGLLTGRYNWRSRLKAGVLPGQAPPLIEAERTTLGSMMQSVGYRTACVGKWHLGMQWAVKEGYSLPTDYSYGAPGTSQDLCAKGIDFSAPISEGPLTRGFDYFYGMPASLDQPPFVTIENDRVLEVPDHMTGVRNLDRFGPSQPTEIEYGPAAPGYDPMRQVVEMDQRALDLVEEYAALRTPFFLYCPMLEVHGPLVPSPEYEGKSGIGIYGDFVLQVDGFMGKLMDTLERCGIADDTLVIFTSDNGCSGIVDYPRLISMGHNPSSIFRGRKSDIWEGGHRIPFLARWPGRIPAGASSGQMMCLTDLFATLAEIVGFEYGDDTAEDSVSVWPILQGGDVPVRDSIMHHSRQNYSIRKGSWKLEFCAGSGGMGRPGAVPDADPDGLPYQLYNLDEDIGEQQNLYGRYPGLESELTAIAKEWVLSGRSTPGAPQENAESKRWPGLDWMQCSAGNPKAR